MKQDSHSSTAKDPWHWHRLAQGLVMKNQPRAAAEAAEKSIRLAPEIGDFHALMARLMIQAGQRVEALRATQSALQLGCQQPESWQDVAVCANLLGRHHDAAKAFAHALRQKAGDVTLLCNAASNARHLGQLEQARHWLQKAVELQPNNTRAWWMLAPLIDDQTEAIRKLESIWQRITSPGHRHYLAFALSRLHESQANHQSAWDWTDTGCRLVRKQQRHDQAHWLARNQQHFHNQTQLPIVFENTTGEESKSPRPLFILGLPRAGSSLLESLLAGHTNIQTLGELPELPLTLAEAKRTTDNADTLLDTLGNNYLAQVKAIHEPKKRWFTDKLPDNSQHLGYILAALPQARILWIDKQPLDAVWSLYKLLFAPGQKGWSYHLPWLGEAIARHHQHMHHWQQVAPERIMRVPYEQLVTQPEDTLAAIQQFLALPDQSDALLAQVGRAVTATASATQVRHGIHARAVNAWKHHAQHIEPARQAMLGAGLKV